ncbi:Uncharacterised protein [Burkholderia pseudomallei]|nr:Uncharacterised protein [Burkholderia pseudomallei]VBY49800.1 Uncharacterised protein [Burkholderia pseudomallei]VBY72733.1 Uncharacterised protein [Burkholderia pseudomallei]VBY72920.1 Uncharacterised protein [Burkholderia pseudomallei]VBY89849.1 Uncharacterised protein [Burkholderia pseudomallei]
MNFFDLPTEKEALQRFSPRPVREDECDTPKA